MVSMVPHQDEYSITRQQMLAGIDVSMGGRVAEELVFGEDQVRRLGSSPAPPAVPPSQNPTLDDILGLCQLEVHSAP
jgi:ATP-dependent metalloprotease